MTLMRPSVISTAASAIAVVTALCALTTLAADATALLGPVHRADLRKPPFSEWFDGQYSRYQPAATAVESLRAPLRGISIEAYFGTWCGDSKRQVPRLIRLLDLAGFEESKLRLTALSDRPMEFKQAPGRPEAKRHVHRTPTIVVLRDGAEIGRIVETPATSLEADLLGILEGHGPEPKYGAEAWVNRLFVDLPKNEALKALEGAGQELTNRSDLDSLWHYAEQDLMKNGKTQEALAVLDLHLRLSPKSVIGHVLRAEVLNTLGRKDEALQAVDRALALDPKNERATRTAARLRPS